MNPKDSSMADEILWTVTITYKPHRFALPATETVGAIADGDESHAAVVLQEDIKSRHPRCVILAVDSQSANRSK